MRHPLNIPIPPYLFDHHLENRYLFPAVEALITLSEAVQARFPLVDVRTQLKGRFPRFLNIPPDGRQIDAIIDIEDSQESRLTAVLLTVMRSKSGGIGRYLEHARVEFLKPGFEESLERSPLSPEPPTGPIITIPVESIYGQLVPFGKAYQNIIGDVSVSPQGAQALLSGGEDQTNDHFLGSPFPFDAAFHLACIWAQRFTETVPFPTGFEKRMIHRKTLKGGRYLGRVTTTALDRKFWIFDALILDAEGVLYEDIRGITMQDVSQGRLHPPQWIKEL